VTGGPDLLTVALSGTSVAMIERHYGHLGAEHAETGSRTRSGRSPIGRNNWLFAGSLRAGKPAAAVMSLVHSARLNGHDPYAYLKDGLERLPTQTASRIGELLPHRWAS
jgi:transposase